MTASRRFRPSAEDSRSFGQLPSGEAVRPTTLRNDGGATMEVLDFGAIVRSLRVPDRRGQLADVVLGFDDIGGYLGHPFYVGAIIGRVAGRIAYGQLRLNDETIRLPQNEDTNHLHGGFVGLNQRRWSVDRRNTHSICLTYDSPHGEEGYPGEVHFAVTYTLTNDHAFVVETEATTDRCTPVSLTHHSYFNLAGEGSGSTEDHLVQVLADAFVPLDEHNAPSAHRELLAGRPNDLRQKQRWGDVLPHLRDRHGDLYHLREFPAAAPAAPTLAARVEHPQSGRRLEVFTDDFCLQLYSGVHLDGRFVGKSGRGYGRYAGICLECQSHPAAAMHPQFGDSLARPGQTLRRRTVYAFSSF